MLVVGVEEQKREDNELLTVVEACRAERPSAAEAEHGVGGCAEGAFMCHRNGLYRTTMSAPKLQIAIDQCLGLTMNQRLKYKEMDNCVNSNNLSNKSI